ncbi:MAG: NAD-dependent epimerase/dehydratase family protein [Candidatus Latescibacteria bacterium]|nr:NAD-dependent epimerase/dehydratase family protein [Candidatus Latescibacterota bacterium]
MKVGITGAEGRIGGYLRSGLADSHQIRSFTLAPQEFASTAVDISDAGAMNGIFSGLDAVIHLAGDPDPAGSWESMLKNNIIGTFNVLEEARRAGVKKVVFASTNHTQHGETMGAAPGILDVSNPVMLRLGDYFNPTSIYGASKATGEVYGRLFAKHHGVQFVAMRIGAIGDEDSPARAIGKPSEDYLRAMFLSRRDLITAFQKALEVDREFTLAYVISNNGRRIFDMRETNENLGFFPQDDAESFFKP